MCLFNINADKYLSYKLKTLLIKACYLYNKPIINIMATTKHSHHEEAATEHESAAKHHRAAHAAHQEGNDEKASSHAHAASGHHAKAGEHAKSASKKHAESHSSKK